MKKRKKENIRKMSNDENDFYSNSNELEHERYVIALNVGLFLFCFISLVIVIMYIQWNSIFPAILAFLPIYRRCDFFHYFNKFPEIISMFYFIAQSLQTILINLCLFSTFPFHVLAFFYIILPISAF